MTAKIQTQAYKGARDFYPEDMLLRNYIFDTWKKVCKSYCFEEYDFPILEPLEVFSAKSGEEIINEQIFSFEDRGKRKIAIRPELTPGTVRMLAQKYGELLKPVKWFMIGNNWRYEKPQLGRGREFYQLEVNIFGIDKVLADFEIFCVIVSIMEAFGAKEGQFEISVNDRRIVSCLLDRVMALQPGLSEKVRKAMDKKSKMSSADFVEYLQEIGLSAEQTELVNKFMESGFENLQNIIPSDILNENAGYQTIVQLFDLLKQNNILKYTKFDPSIIRGFDYSDGLVYEVFDKNPGNRRSIFGGERFDKLINIFGDYNLPATGFAMGDITLAEFLKNWDLLPKFNSGFEYFVCVWPSENAEYYKYSLKVSETLRSKGYNTFLWPESDTKIDKQLKYADKKGFKYAIIIGDSEIETNSVTIKNLADKTQIKLAVSQIA